MELILTRWSWAISALLSLAGSFLVARTVNTFTAAAIAPKPSLLSSGPAGITLGSQSAPHEELPVERFAKLFDVPGPKKEDPAAVAAAEQQKSQASMGAWDANPVRSTLHGLLVSTAMAKPEKFSLCQITNQDTNETLVYAVNEMFMGARIYAIEKERVLVDNQGKNEYIDNSAAASPQIAMATPPPATGGGDGVRVVGDNNYVVAKHEIDSALANLSDLATKARIVPSFKNGVSNGFKLFSIVPDSLYAKIGIQNGDVIRRINGYEMNSPDKALEIYQKLRDANRVEVELERRGETVRKSYSIE
ncbi:MAG: general secretion pathway protein GspC [Deltaproteobacteria bacterium]|nr:general secretion pathway protein GspC [Deltaproteobacteria bacterium]